MREKRILNELLHSEQYCSLEYLANCLNVSTRTISNDMKYLAKDGEQHGFQIHLKRRLGYYLEIVDKQKFQMYMKQNQYHVVNGKERVDIIIAMLLMRQEFVTQETIADLLQVSKSIIKVDMSKVEKALFEHSIILIKKAHYGLTLECKSMNRKLYLLELLENKNIYVSDIIKQYHPIEKVQSFEKQFIQLLKKYELNTNYIELKKIDAFLKITILLAEKGVYSDEKCELQKNKYIDIARELKEVVEEIYHIELNDIDVLDISEYLKQKTKPINVYLNNDGLSTDIEDFLITIDTEYHTHFNDDTEFKKGLLSHVSLLLDRLNQSISFSNPLVHELSVKYPMMFNICIRFAAMLEDKYHVKTSHDEIGFIATHFAAHMEKELFHKLKSYHRIAIICSSGGGSAFLIKLKLETIFSSSNIQTFSLLEMEEVKEFEPDIIFTIKQLDEDFHVPIVLIKELLDDADINKIKNMLQTDSSLLLQNKSFQSLFQKNAFFIFHEGTYSEMVTTMCKALEKEKYCEENYTNLVQQREEVLSTIYQNGIAIPHPLEMCGHRNILSVGIVKHDASEHDKKVQVIFLVNLKKGDLKLHQNISKVLFEVMSDEALIGQIRCCESYEDFMKCIAHLNF